MKISIIITVYNEEKYLKQCLLSLKKQTCCKFEIILVNDGSTDNSWQTLLNLKSQISNLKIFNQNHRGPAKARNFAVKNAEGKILVFVDGDMFFDKDFLKKLVYPIKLGKTKGTYSTEEYVANWENIWARCWNYNWNLTDRKRIDLKRTDQARDFRAIFKTEFSKADGFDDVGYTDTWTLAEKLGYQPQATQAKYYHFNPASLKEVFYQARWVAKRPYKLGNLGFLLALARANPVFSLFNGIRKAIAKKEPAFIVFKLTYDLGLIVGLLDRRKYA